MSHSLIVLSSEPEANSRPSGLNATDLTQSVWPDRWDLPLAEPNLSRIPCGHKQDRYGRADAEKLCSAHKAPPWGLPCLPLAGAGPPCVGQGPRRVAPRPQF
jgi:hypothetical protein